ncbi:hypothetical protein NP233_g8873 [Leucocoprinus birnbaumii]|uniref:BZIP domain-containing protein n=1 Tax=Leucocoprinus birnbaumii TaxID=56174 RepID=A0AAD5VLH8_9AGAR|nr:hypothetical protein NP233_g8873 [Leucocoprinus birnbaumii]
MQCGETRKRSPSTAPERVYQISVKQRSPVPASPEKKGGSGKGKTEDVIRKQKLTCACIQRPEITELNNLFIPSHHQVGVSKKPMPMPANIQGLNIVQPQQVSSDSQDLLSAQAFPDISAQLDLWTNLTFDTDEGSLTRADDDKYEEKSLEEEEEEETKSAAGASSEKAVHDGHVNVVTGTNLGSNAPSNIPQPATLPSLPGFDLNSLLSGFDPYANLSQHTNSGTAPSLAQLLALHSHAQQFPTPMPNPFSHYPAASSVPYSRLPPILTSPPPPRADIGFKSNPSVNAFSSPEASVDAQGMAVAAAEDKRRRNTAASARFRLKKKEREAALEGKAKELEARVSELERECEGLRRENGWLKGLVVGVTGAAQGPVVTSPPPSLTPAQLASLTNATATAKRNREEADA